MLKKMTTNLIHQLAADQSKIKFVTKYPDCTFVHSHDGYTIMIERKESGQHVAYYEHKKLGGKKIQDSLKTLMDLKTKKPQEPEGVFEGIESVLNEVLVNLLYDLVHNPRLIQSVKKRKQFTKITCKDEFSFCIEKNGENYYIYYSHTVKHLNKNVQNELSILWSLKETQ